MLLVPVPLIPKHALVSLETSKTTVPVATQESGLVQEDILMTPTRVETRRPKIDQIMVKRRSKPWATFWFSDIPRPDNRKRHATSDVILALINM